MRVETVIGEASGGEGKRSGRGGGGVTGDLVGVD